MALFIVDFCDPSTGGGGGSGSNVTSLTYTPSTEVLNLTTDQPASFNTTIPTVKVDNTFFVSDQYGNDGTAVQGSMTLKYQTIDAALAAAVLVPDSVVYVMPGNYSVTTMVSVTSGLKIYLMPGANLQSNGAPFSFSVDPAITFRIEGYGDIERNTPLAGNSNPSNAIPCEIYIRGRYIQSSGANAILDASSMKFGVEFDGIYDSYIDCLGWCYGYVATDLWRTSFRVLNLSRFSGNDGETKYQDYGPQEITIKGRSRKRAKIENETQCNGIYLESGVESYKTQVYLDCDFTSQDGFFVDQGRGIIKHNGNLFHSKSNLAGNEVPWWYTIQPIEEQYKPTWHHVEGSYVSATHPAFAGSQNNEIISLRVPCIMILDGQYENSGLDSGLGPWAIVHFSNLTSTGGATKLVLNGEFSSNGGAVAPIRLVNGFQPAHTLRLEVRNATIRTRFNYCIDTDFEVTIWTYYSLNANQNYNPLITEGFSEDRTIIDSNVTVDIPEYGV